MDGGGGLGWGPVCFGGWRDSAILSVAAAIHHLIARLPPPLSTQVVECELVSRQMRALVDMEGSGAVAMLAGDKCADLARMHALFRRVEGGLDLLRTVRRC